MSFVFYKSPDECEHRAEILISVPAGSSLQYKHLCTDCGRRGNPIKHDDLTDDEKNAATPATSIYSGDESVYAYTHKKIDSARQGLHRRLRDDPEYLAYLRSGRWRMLRKQVIGDAGGRCQGCGSYSDSLDVHHLTYAHLYGEFLCELVAFCRDCHDRWHGADLLDETG